MLQPHCLNKTCCFAFIAVSSDIGRSVATLVEQNLDDADARHLMVLTKVRGAFHVAQTIMFSMIQTHVEIQ
jgi:hypothetical protein